MHARIHRLLTAALVLGGCAAPSTPPIAEGSGLDSGSTSATSGASTPTTSTTWATDTTGASEVDDTDPPVVGPCRDGIVVDVARGRSRGCELLFEGGITRAHGVDLDADGRDEVFVDGATSFPDFGLFRWTGSEVLEQRVSGSGGGYYDQCMVRYDFDTDGTRDLSCVKSGLVQPPVWSIVAGGLGELIPQPPLPGEVLGGSAALPIDIDVDGVPERLAAVVEPIPQRGYYLHRQVDDALVTMGTVHQLEGCGRPSNVAYADFDEDGVDDVAVLDHPTLCDSYPLNYDSSWHLVHVLLSRPNDMEHSVSVPTGAIPTLLFGQAFAGDLDGDGHADLAVTLEAPGLMSYASGNGDGTFGAATTVMADELGLPLPNGGGLGTLALYFGQFDADPAPELVASAYPDRTWVIDDPAAGLAILEAYELEATPRGIGDFDGDGIDDLVMSTSGSPSESLLLLSAAD